MAKVVEALDSFRQCVVDRGNPELAEGYISNIISYFEEELGDNERDSALAALFNDKSGLPPVLLKAYPSKKYKNAVVCSFVLVKYVTNYFRDYIAHFVRSIKHVCLSCLTRFDTSAIEKEKACDALCELLVTGQWGEELDVKELINLLLNQASESKAYNTASRVLQKLLHILGILAHHYPEHMTSHADVLFKLLRFQLLDQKTKRETVVIVGCLNGLAEYLHSFSQPLEDNDGYRREVYSFIKFFLNFESDMIQRAAIKIMIQHSYLIQNNLYEDYKWWYEHLNNKLLNTKNSEDRRMSREALQSLKNLVSKNVYDKEDAIEGLGKFSQSCFKYMTEENVMSLFTLLMQQAQELSNEVKDVNEDTRKSLQMFPHFVKTIANIIMHFDHFEFETSNLQHMGVKLVQLYVVTPVKFRSFTVDSLITLIYSLTLKQGLIFDDFISIVMYQALIRTCSTDHNENLVTLWCALSDIRNYIMPGMSLAMKQGIINKIYNTSINTILRMIGKLDLRVCNKENEIITQDDPNLGLEAKNVSDFKVFINLVNFVTSWLPKTDFFNFRQWAELFIQQIIKELYRNPLVSGFYKILTVCFHICEQISYFLDQELGASNESRPIYLEICKVLQHILFNLKNQKGELQVSCIYLFLETPIPLLPSVQHRCIEIFQTAFRVGRSYLHLASKALTTLDKWKYIVSEEEMKAILPELEPYLQNKDIVPDKELEQFQYQVRQLRRKYIPVRKKLVEMPESELLQLQRNILHFLGPLDYSTSIALLNKNEDYSLSWGHTKLLMFKIPFKTMNIFIYLDSLLPQVINLALSCPERRTRIVACELFHAVTIFMVGTCKQMSGEDQNRMSELFENVFLPLLQLSCDTDDVVCQLFNPLVLQLAHWYSSPFQLRSKNTEVFVNTIFDGIAHPSDASLRDISSKCLHEFVEWSIKQQTTGKYEESSFNIQIIVKRICMLSCHPNRSKRLGGALAFNSIYRVIREDKVVIDELYLELCYFMVKNLSLSKSSVSPGVKNEAEQAVDHVLRVLKEQSHIFNSSSSSKRRRKPPEFDGDKLIDAVKWLLYQCNSKHKDCRRKCKEMIHELAPYIINCDSSETFINCFISEEGIEKFLKIVEGRINDDLLSYSFSDLEKAPLDIMLWLQRIESVLDFYIWLIHNSSVALSLTTNKESMLIHSMKSYIFMCTSHKLQSGDLMDKSEITQDEYELYNQAKSVVALRIFEFLSDVMKCSKNNRISLDICQKMFDTSFCKLLCKCVFESSSFGFNANESTVDIFGILKTFLLNFSKFAHECKMDNGIVQELNKTFIDKATLLKENIQEKLTTCDVNPRDKSILQGLILIQECELYNATDCVKDELHNSFINYLFESVGISFGCSNKAVALEPLAQSFGKDVLKFACCSESQIKLLIEYLLNATCLSTETSSLQHGEHFQATFREVIMQILLNFIECTLDILLGESMLCTQNRRIFSILEQICQYAVEKRNSSLDLCLKVHKEFLNYWTPLQHWASLSSINICMVLDILKYVALSAEKKLGCLEKHMAGKWILSLFPQTLPPSLKIRLLDFLPYLIPSPMQISDIVKEKIFYFFGTAPKDTSELIYGSIQYNDFVQSFHKLLNIMAVTGSLFVFERIIAMTVSDENHICNNKIKETIPNFVASLNCEEQFHAIEVGYNVFINTTQYAPQIRLNCVQNFVISLMKHCQDDATIHFVSKHVGEILDFLRAPLPSLRPIQIEHKLVSKIGSWLMVEVFFSVISRDKFDSPQSGITEAARSHVDPGKTVIGDFCALAYRSRSINLPSNATQDLNLKELIRKMKCSAYVALVVIVCNTKDELKFFTGFLFKENRAKNETLWDQLVNCSQTYSFPMVWDEIPKRRKFLSGIRQKNQNNVQYIATDTQILVNSTLAEDVTLFDLSTSIYQSPAAKSNSNNNFMTESLEDDDLNRHECMSTICVLIKHMTENKLYALPKETESRPKELPSWMEELRKSMMDDSKHQNVRIFLTKIILNCEQIFKPFASFWLYPLMQIVVNGCLGHELNYMVMDVISLLISWHDVAKPSANETEKMLANQILEFLLVNAPSERRDIFKYNLDTVRTLVEMWKCCFMVPHQKLLDLLSVPSKDDRTKGEAGIHIASIFLANGVQPWNDLGKQIFFLNLTSSLSLDNKLLCPSSELIGMGLKHMDPEFRGDLSEEYNIMNSIKRKISCLEKDSGKFLHCLHCISRHYPPFLDYFLKNVLYFLSKVSGKFKIMCVEMVCARLEAIEENVFVELENKNLLSLLDCGDADLQQAVLLLFFKMLPKLTLSKQQAVLDKCISLSTIRSVTCRASIYKILMWGYEQDILSDDGKSVLLKGIIESDANLQEQIHNFWKSEKNLSPAMPNRILDIMSTMYCSKSEQYFLSSTLLLLLDPGIFGVEYDSNMFQHPLSQCDYRQLEVVLSVHKQRTSLQPLFSQVSSTAATYQTFPTDFQLKATQSGVLFQPTVEGSLQVSNTIPSTIVSSLQLTSGSKSSQPPSSAPEFKRPYPFRHQNFNPYSFKTRRLLKDIKQVNRKHAAIAAIREARQRELYKNRFKERDNKISLYRTYRVGDFPDIQIPFSAVIKPLQILVKYNNNIARQIMISLFTSILKELKGEKLCTFSSDMIMIFQNMMQKTSGLPVVVGTILEMILVCREHITLQTDIISSVSKESGLSMLGCLVLEEKLITRKALHQGPVIGNADEENNCWLRIAELYQDLQEWDVVHGIFSEKLICCREAKLGIKAESEANWIDAKNFYESAILSDDANNQKDYYYEAFFQCLAHLSDWNQLHQCILEQVDDDRNNVWSDQWNKQHLLPQLFACEINLLGSGDSSVFFKALEYWLKDEEKSQYIQSHLTEELAVLYAIKPEDPDFVKSQVFTRNCFLEFLSDWIVLNSASFKQRATVLRDVHRFSELHVFLDFMSPSNKNKDPDNLISLWKACLPTPFGSLLDWDKKINYRIQFMKHLKKEFTNFSKVWDNTKVEMQLAMVDAALEQNNFGVAEKYLTLVKENQCSLPPNLNLLLILEESKHLRLQALKASRVKDKIISMIKAASMLNKYDPCKNELWNENWVHQFRACQLMGNVACEIWGVLFKKPEIIDSLNEVNKSSLHEWLDSWVEDATLIETVHRCGLTYLHKAVNIALDHKNSLEKHSNAQALAKVADAYFKMAEYYEKTNDNAIEISYFLSSILRAMKFGSKGAHCLFPRLLQISKSDFEWENTFIEESSEIPEWMFLKWINQILACLDKPVGKVLHQVTIRVAKVYPQALTWPYRISREKYDINNIPLNVVSELDSLLTRNTLIETFLKAMSCLCQPEMVLSHYIEEAIKSAQNKKGKQQNVQEVCAKLKIKIQEITHNPIKGSLFHDMAVYIVQLTQALDNLKENKEKSIENLKTLKSQLYEKAYKRSFQKIMLQKYSPWLSEFQISYWGDYLELPGQYLGDTQPHPQHLIRIAGFSQEIQVIRSMRLPIKLVIIGNDGKEYAFLVKYGEDLRQDQRIQQLFNVMNDIFSKDSACLHRQLKITTYQVVPLSCQIGMIQWIENTKTLKNCVVDVLDEQEDLNYKRAFEMYLSWLKSAYDSEDKIMLHRNAYKYYSRQDTIKSFEERCKLVPWDVLRRSFLYVSKNPEEFFCRRQKFACSYAVMCISHWVLGIGDRHLENCLIKQVDGSAVGIDFGYAFGCGIQFIPIPELMPFRLTPHIINLMQPFENTGLLRGSMIHCLRALRNDSQILLATMEVFVNEPSINWVEIAQKRYEEEVNEWFPQEQLHVAKEKLEGVNPIVIGSHELECGHKNSKYFIDYLKVLQGEERLIKTKDAKQLPVSDQVDCLIELATDPHILGKTWIGWEPWV